jgi:hypothetical protein
MVKKPSAEMSWKLVIEVSHFSPPPAPGLYQGPSTLHFRFHMKLRIRRLRMALPVLIARTNS